MGKYLLRRFNEKSVGHSLRLIERNGQGLCLCFAAQLHGRIPVRHSGVKRIENDVAAMLVIELLHELACRVIDDGAVAACIYLIKQLANDARLA